MQKKYIISGIVGVLALGGAVTAALEIKNPSGTTPLYKAIFIGGTWDRNSTCNGLPSCVNSTAPVCMDLCHGIWINPTNNPVGATVSNPILKLQNMSVAGGLINGDDIANTILTSIHFVEKVITTEKIAYEAINTRHIIDGAIDTSKLGKDIRVPATGEVIRTNDICATGTVLTKIDKGVGTCVPAPSSLPTSCAHGSKAYYDTVKKTWTCDSAVLGVLSAAGDAHWEGTTTGDIWNKNFTGKVGVGITTPSTTLTIQDSFSVNANGAATAEQVFCHKTNSWVEKSTYNEANCAVCETGYSYNPTSKLCEKFTCGGTCKASISENLQDVGLYIYVPSSGQYDRLFSWNVFDIPTSATGIPYLAHKAGIFYDGGNTIYPLPIGDQEDGITLKYISTNVFSISVKPNTSPTSREVLVSRYVYDSNTQQIMPVCSNVTVIKKIIQCGSSETYTSSGCVPK